MKNKPLAKRKMRNNFYKWVGVLEEGNQKGERCSPDDLEGTIASLSCLVQEGKIIKSKKFSERIETVKKAIAKLSEKELAKDGWSSDDMDRYPLAISVFKNIVNEIDIETD